MIDIVPCQGEKRRKASLGGDGADAQLTGVRSRCETRLRDLSGSQPLGIDRARTERLWPGIAILVSESEPVQQFNRFSRLSHEPEQAILRCQ